MKFSNYTFFLATLIFLSGPLQSMAVEESIKNGNQGLDDLSMELEAEELDFEEDRELLENTERETRHQQREASKLKSKIKTLGASSDRVKSKNKRLSKRFVNSTKYAKDLQNQANSSKLKLEKLTYKVKYLTKKVDKMEARAIQAKKSKRKSIRDLGRQVRKERALKRRQKNAQRIIKKYDKIIKKNKAKLRKVSRATTKLNKKVYKLEMQAIRYKKLALQRK